MYTRPAVHTYRNRFNFEEVLKCWNFTQRKKVILPHHSLRLAITWEAHCSHETYQCIDDPFCDYTSFSQLSFLICLSEQLRNSLSITFRWNNWETSSHLNDFQSPTNITFENITNYIFITSNVVVEWAYKIWTTKSRILEYDNIFVEV